MTAPRSDADAIRAWVENAERCIGGRHEKAALAMVRVMLEAADKVRPMLKAIAGPYDITLAQFDPKMRRTPTEIDAIEVIHMFDGALARVRRIAEGGQP